MSERVPPRPPPPPPLPIHANPHSPNFTTGTFIVQIPKDQIYRVPPPENAIIAEIHRNPPPNNFRRKCYCSVFLALLLIGIIIGCVLGGLSSVLNKAKSPKFSVQRFLFTAKPQPHYTITFKVHNSDSKVGFLYKKGGEVSLSLRQDQIASGAYPSFFQDPNNSTTFGIELEEDTEGQLPKEVQKSMKNPKNKMRIPFSISMNLPTQTKMGSLHRTTKHDVNCQVTVDTLAKGTRVLSQDCQTKRL